MQRAQVSMVDMINKRLTPFTVFLRPQSLKVSPLLLTMGFTLITCPFMAFMTDKDLEEAPGYEFIRHNSIPLIHLFN